MSYSLNPFQTDMCSRIRWFENNGHAAVFTDR
jgi:hypothetical protein